jgi:hypothetical protein
MGRGLSDLQRGILRLALARHEQYADREDRSGGPPRPADVYAHDVLHHLYGWPASRTGRLYYGRVHHFSSAEIGRTRYGSDRTAVARALARAAQRGLLEHAPSYTGAAGWNLTPAGLAYARGLSANNGEKHRLLADSPTAD